MKNSIKALAAISFLAFAAAGCDVDQTKEGDMPEVDVNVSGGQLPEFNVTGPEVNVTTENVTVEVPKVDVDMPKD